MAGAEASFRFSQNQISGVWTLRQGRAKLARSKWGRDATIQTLEGTLPFDELALLLRLAIETMRCEASIPQVSESSGGG